MGHVDVELVTVGIKAVKFHFLGDVICRPEIFNVTRDDPRFPREPFA